MRTCLGPAPASLHARRRTSPEDVADATLPAAAAGPTHWGSLHHDWQNATDARPAHTQMAKEPLPSGVMMAILEHRVRAIRVLQDALDREPGLRRRINALQPHARDAHGRNWDIPALDSRSARRAGHEAELRRVVDALRDQFELA